MQNDTELRKALIDFRENVIFSDYPQDDERRRTSILRKKMINWLIKTRPLDVGEWYCVLPDTIYLKTDIVQFTLYGDQIINILNRYRRRVSLRFLKRQYLN